MPSSIHGIRQEEQLYLLLELLQLYITADVGGTRALVIRWRSVHRCRSTTHQSMDLSSLTPRACICSSVFASIAARTLMSYDPRVTRSIADTGMISPIR